MRAFFYAVSIAAALVLTACIDVEQAKARHTPFNYETATPEAQTEWLTKEAEAMTLGFKRGLNVGPRGFNIDPPRVNIKQRTILITAHAQGGSDLTFNVGQSRNIHKVLCENYLKSKLMTYGVVSTFVIKRKNSSTALRLSDGKRVCEQVVAAP